MELLPSPSPPPPGRIGLNRGDGVAGRKDPLRCLPPPPGRQPHGLHTGIWDVFKVGQRGVHRRGALTSEVGRSYSGTIRHEHHASCAIPFTWCRPHQVGRPGQLRQPKIDLWGTNASQILSCSETASPVRS